MATLQTIEEIVRIRCYSINQDLEFQEVEGINVNSDNQILYWAKEYYGKATSASHWRIYEYQIYDNHGNLMSALTKNDWSFSKIKSLGDQGQVYFHGTDPRGRMVQKAMGNRILGVVNAISFLNELSNFSSWEAYQLQKRNDELREKLDQLVEKRDWLRSQLEQGI